MLLLLLYIPNEISVPVNNFSSNYFGTTANTCNQDDDEKKRKKNDATTSKQYYSTMPTSTVLRDHGIVDDYPQRRMISYREKQRRRRR